MTARTAADDASADYPLIRQMDSGDEVFRQYIQDVEHNRRLLFNSKTGEDASGIASHLTIYRYRPSGAPVDTDLFALAARCNIPYASLASLNRLGGPAELSGLETVLLPSMPGLFVPARPRGELERLIAAGRPAAASRPAAAGRPAGEQAVNLTIRAAGKTAPGTNGVSDAVFAFYPGADYNATERIFFLNPFFRFPLRDFVVSSPYGGRVNPVTGRYGLHHGMDLAAPSGTPVYAAAAGTVTEVGEDPVYGKYVVIKHRDNFASLYGHLSKINVVLRKEVGSATLIGEVGSTGQSTGPHLHFELRHNGKAEDPGRYLFKGP